MKFSDLDDFVNNQMDVYHDKHFQQIVISTLIQNGGKATIDELREQVLKIRVRHINVEDTLDWIFDKNIDDETKVKTMLESKFLRETSDWIY